MDTAKVAAAVKELTKAEAKLKKLQDGRDAYIAAATKKASDNYDGKIGDATQAVDAAKTSVKTILL